MAETLVSLATPFFDQLSDAEIAMLDAAETGVHLLPDPAWSTGIRSAVLRWLCSEAEAKAKVFRGGLVVDGFDILGPLELTYAEIPFPLYLQNCIFDGEIHMKGTHFKTLSLRGTSTRGIHADSVSIDANLLLIEGFSSRGETALRGASIGGDFRTDGSSFSNIGHEALICDRIKVLGGVFLSRESSKSTFLGEVRFSGADIGGNLDAAGAVFWNGGRIALSADRLRTGGSVFLRAADIDGEVVLGHSRIAVNLDCCRARLRNDGERTLNLERTAVNGHVLLADDCRCDKASFLAAVVSGGLRCRLSQVGAINLRHARIEGPFEWKEMIAPSASSIDFRDASIGSLSDDEMSWPGRGHIHFDGLRFERFSDAALDVRARLKWLSLDDSLPAQAYHQLSNVYERAGRSDLARQVLFHFEILARSRDSNFLRGVWSCLLRFTIGYGYKLWRAAVIMLILTVVGFGLAFLGYSTKLIAPNDKDANAYFILTGRSPTHYPRFSASMYSIEHSLPAMNLGVASGWSADATAKWPTHPFIGPTLRVWFWIQTLLGWLLSIFFIAGLTGVVKSSK